MIISIHSDWVSVADSLPSDSDRGIFYSAICHYVLTGLDPDLPPNIAPLFMLIRHTLTTSRSRRKNAEDRWQKNENILHTQSANANENILHTQSANTNENILQEHKEQKKEEKRKEPKEKNKKKEQENSIAQTRENKAAPGSKDWDDTKTIPETFVAFIPMELSNDPEFRVTWLSWEKYRREIRHKLVKSTALAQLNFLRKYKPETACSIINNSIRMGYQGLFDPKTQQNAITQERKDYTGV